MKRSYWFALTGLLLGLGSPLGAVILLWLGPHLEMSFPDFLVRTWQANNFWLNYMLDGTCLVFAVVGYRLGREEDSMLQHNRRLSDQVTTDPLTGLGNHRLLHENLQREFGRHLASRKPLSCLMMDLDFFKKVNDTYGHPYGDYVLKHFAKIIQGAVRQGDIATRYGGEEFFCVLPDCDPAEALRVAERIREKTENYDFSHENHHAKVTVSLGAITCADLTHWSYEKLIQAADKSLYEAKHSGRNRVVAIELKPKQNH